MIPSRFFKIVTFSVLLPTEGFASDAGKCRLDKDHLMGIEEALEEHSDLDQLRVMSLRSKLYLPRDTDAKFLLIYQHGFSGSPPDIEPVPQRVADELRAPLFSLRAHGHGMPYDGFSESTFESQKKRLKRSLDEIAKSGCPVYFLTLSNGVHYALEALNHSQLKVLGLSAISPNFHPKNKFTRLFLWPGGLSLAKLLFGNDRVLPETDREDILAKWNRRYSWKAVSEMMKWVQNTEKKDLSFSSLPPAQFVLTQNDQVVDTKAMKKAFENWGSMTKSWIELNDLKKHELAGDSVDPEANEIVARVISSWAKTVVSRE